MTSEQGLLPIVQPRTMADVEQVLQRGDLYGSLVSFLLTCLQEGNTPETIRGHKLKLGQFVKYAKEQFHITDPKLVTDTHLKLFIVHKMRNCTATTANNHYRELHRFFAYLKEQKVIVETPMLNMHPPKKEQRIIEPFSSEQIKDMLAICDDETFLGARNKAMIYTFIDTGLRLSELTNIRLGDVNIQTDTIKVMGKGNKERVVPFGKKTKAALLKYQRARNSPLTALWLTEERTPLTARGIEITVIRMGRYAGIQGVRCSPHTFRHFFGTNAMLNGAPDWAVQQLLGHATLTMTEKYRKTVNSWNAVTFHRGTAKQPGFSPADRLE
jgi:integrase/recombinase XerC